jgi:hypothetical protein
MSDNKSTRGPADAIGNKPWSTYATSATKLDAAIKSLGYERD